jgi:hypothetical protein
MAMITCIEIGKPEDFGGNKSQMLVLANSAPDGIADVIDTCDINEAFGNTGISNEDTFKLFTGKDTKLLPEEDLQKRITFFEKYPKLSELGKQIQELYKKDDPKTFIGLLEWYYGQITTAHNVSGVPFIPEEQDFVTKIMALLIYRGEDELAEEIIKWSCGSINFPEVFFLGAAESLVESQWETDLIDHQTGEIKQDNFLTLCIAAATDPRKAVIAQMIGSKVAKENPAPDKAQKNL